MERSPSKVAATLTKPKKALEDVAKSHFADGATVTLTKMTGMKSADPEVVVEYDVVIRRTRTGEADPSAASSDFERPRVVTVYQLDQRVGRGFPGRRSRLWPLL